MNVACLSFYIYIYIYIYIYMIAQELSSSTPNQQEMMRKLSVDVNLFCKKDRARFLGETEK